MRIKVAAKIVSQAIFLSKTIDHEAFCARVSILRR
jgi:hypothetical protein